MTNYRAIVELVLAGRSYVEIVEIVGCSRRDVSRVKQAIQEHGVASAAAVSDAELGEWFPDGRRRVSDEYEQPDLSRVLASMKQNRHFTLLQAWRRLCRHQQRGQEEVWVFAVLRSVRRIRANPRSRSGASSRAGSGDAGGLGW